MAIERSGRTLHAVAPSEVLHDGDVLWFAGSPDGVISLRKVPGAASSQARCRYDTCRAACGWCSCGARQRTLSAVS